ncbi:MAG: polysaccharide deacetylase family protein [Bacteroidales bacterium]|nr:polysaccharide deacetylase family protein [Bacteroidales bacterium]
MRKLYTFIRKIFPTQWHGILTVLLYYLKIKPTVNRRVKSPFSKGIIVISADFEMAWAFRYSKTKGSIAEQLGLRERENVPKLLTLFEKYQIPITWATVGHLFLDSCSKEQGSNAHPMMPRHSFFENSNWSFCCGDWYEHDPCTNYIESPAWYAPDLIDQIMQSSVGHEIGCHTFSHIDCTDKNCPPDLFDAELKACIEHANKKGIQLKSMVFPGGTNGNYSTLKELGFTSYRKATNYHIDIPFINNDGLVQIPSSYNLDRSNLNWSAERYIRMANSFVSKASKHKMVAHLWFHPSMDSWYIENVFPFVLEYIKKHVDENRVVVLTMAQLSEKMKGHELD